MAKFVSSRNTVSSSYLKRKNHGSAAVIKSKYEDVSFTRIKGGWIRVRTDITSETPSIVSSADVARECNKVVGCKESWAKVY